jgi:predicted CoA-substrate-specific enzyme activase
MEAIVDGVLVELGLREAVILDVGGQDAKALYVREGRLQDFAVNDRCAASSGRFLENMARVLGISLEELGRYWENPVRLSSTCAVFGETELIGLMGEGCPMESLAAGVNWAVAGRLLPLLARFPPLRLVLTGGGAYNAALCRILAEKTGREALVPRHPDFVAAEGCCRRAMEDRST